MIDILVTENSKIMNSLDVLAPQLIATATVRKKGGGRRWAEVLDLCVPNRDHSKTKEGPIGTKKELGRTRQVCEQVGTRQIRQVQNRN
jgi:hypothetical protein